MKHAGEIMILKQFEIIGVEIAIEQLKGDWFNKYTMTSEQHEQWRLFCLELIRKKLKINKLRAQKEFTWFNLNYGLKIQDETN